MIPTSDRGYEQIVRAVVPLWQELLSSSDVRVDEQTDFFKAGGHSLSAMLLVARIEQELGKSVPLFALRDHSTVSSLAKYLLEAEAEVPTADPKSMDGTESQTEYLLRFNDDDRQNRRNGAFERYYARAMSSAVHAEFCRRVYGKNFGQHGMADFTQLDLMLDKLAPKPGDVVLDLGCGYGLISNYIAERTGANVVGVDLSPSAIEYASGLAQKNPKLRFEVQDLRDLRFPAGTFSHIVSIDTIYYTPAPRLTLQRFKEIGNDALRVGIVRTFPIRTFTKETWDPHVTELATLLRETFGGYEAVDFSKEENEHWRKKVEVLDTLKEEFIAEGNEDLFQFRYTEAKYEAGIEQLRYMFLSGCGFAAESSRN